VGGADLNQTTQVAEVTDPGILAHIAQDRIFGPSFGERAKALLQEHFAIGAKDWKGVHVMTIHKSKGKEFDQVIV
jgi:ATP-dependent exoDNAse (exonuclease V) beta subunit